MQALIFILSLFLLSCGSSDKDTTSDDSGIVDTGDSQTLPFESYLPPRACDTVFELAGSSAPGVFLAGDFNNWSSTDLPMQEDSDGVFRVSVDLEPGAYAYKFVEKDGDEQWRCDPEAELLLCDVGYDTAQWNDCSPGADSCNALMQVQDCTQPKLHIVSFQMNDDRSTATVSLGYEPGRDGAQVAELFVRIDGEQKVIDWAGDGVFELVLDGLNPGRHQLDFELVDGDGHSAEPVFLPFWSDGKAVDDGLLYYVFVDRFANGDVSNDVSAGTVSSATDYWGGDWVGVEGKLDELLALGVSAIWLTAPIDNAEGAWGDECGTDYSAYHGYWPTSAFDFESNFGEEADFRSLVTAAHQRGIRVIVDWVGNHVHEDHPYRSQYPEWFAEEALLCDEANNWNDFPETCWFDPFLPDVNYFQAAPMLRMVQDAYAFAGRYQLDGYRVDAVKHMPRSLTYNLSSVLRGGLEHPGTDFSFYSVGETFDGDRELLAAYVGEELLDGQFDFPLYFTLREAMLGWGATLEDLEASLEASQSVFGDALMSTFLGNHDVERFITQAAEGAHGECDPNGNFWNPASAPAHAEPYERLRLGWSWLLTRPGLPLVYYGDEIGLPGYFDPDNRQPMRFGSELSEEEEKTRAHVERLGQARRNHKALSSSTSQIWWTEASLLARVSQSGEDWAMSVINTSSDARVLVNGLAWAGMPEGRWEDVLTGESFSSEGDELEVQVPALGSRVLIYQGE